MKMFLFLLVMQHSMIFFFHHYELPALLEQIRNQQQQQQQQMHQDQQAANHQPGPGNNAQPDDDLDQFGIDRPVSTSTEEQHASVNDLAATTDADNTSDQLSSANRGEQEQSPDVAEHQLYVSPNVAGIIMNTLHESTAATSPTTAGEDSHHHFSAADDVLLLPSHSVPVNTADVGRLPSPVVDSAMELRRRCHVSNSASLWGSHETFTSYQDRQELCTDRPGSGPVMTDSSLTDVSHTGNSSNVLSNSPSDTE